MKNKIVQLFIAFLAIGFVDSCNEDAGTLPGNDPNPAVTIYQYKPSRPYNADNDIIIRVAANNKTTEAYYLAEKTANMGSMDENAHMDYVVSKGTKLAGISGESNADITLTGLYGNYTITVVAVGNGTKTSSATTFSGLDWNEGVTGTYYFEVNANMANLFGKSKATVLQVCTTDPTLYRFKDVFGEGYSLKIKLLNIKGKDSGGEYTFFRIPVADTPLTYGKYGIVSVRDIGYMAGSDAYVTDYGYESGMYADHSCFLCIQYFVAAGSLGWGYDEFIPD